MAELEFKSAVTGVKVLDEGEGIVQAIVSVTNVVDSVNDRILPGAYKDTLKKRTPKGLRGHDWNRMVAKTLHAEELMPGDPRIAEISPRIAAAGGGGLLIRGQYNLNTQLGREAYEDAKFFGDEAEFSVGYKVPKGMSSIVPKTGVREIKAMDLYEWSDVAFGAAPLTAGTASVKSAIVSMIEAGALTEDEIRQWADMFEREGKGVTEVLEAATDRFAKYADLSPECDGCADHDDDCADCWEKKHTYWDGEAKVRRVRTPEGAREYGQPIGSVIKPDVAPNKPKKVMRAGAEARPRAAKRISEEQVSRREDTTNRYIEAYLNEPDRDYAEEFYGEILRRRGVDPSTLKGTSGPPTPREAQEAADEIGDAEVDRITRGRGLSGASDAELRRIVEFARRRRRTRRKVRDDDLEKKAQDLLEHTEWDGESKVRRIRTPEGARRYGQPIGTVIRRDMVPGGRRGGAGGAVPSGRGRSGGAPGKRRGRRAAPSATPRVSRESTIIRQRKVSARGERALRDLNPDFAEGLLKVGPPDVVTDDPEQALAALADGKRVEMRQPRQVSTLLNRMLEVVADAKAKDKAARKKWADAGRDPDLYDLAQKAKADPDPERMRKFLDAGGVEADLDLVETIPDYNLCAITVKGTNLFCTQHKDMTRLTMPQLAGRALPGSPAEAILAEQNEERRRSWVAAGNDPDDWERAPESDGGPTSEVNLADHFREHLRSIGFTTAKKKEKASFLKASQRELVGANVAGMMASMLNTNPDGTPKDPTKRHMPPGRIFISRDYYVLDGHHRWAAVVGADLEDNVEGDLDMDVEVVDADILELLALTVDWTTKMGVPPKGGGKGSGGESVSAQEGRKMGVRSDVETKNLGPDTQLAALLTDTPAALDALSEDDWGALLDDLHGDDLQGVKSIVDAVEADADLADLSAGDYRARYLAQWAERLDAKVGLSDTELEAIIDGLEAKAKRDRDHSSRIHPGLDRSPKENWVDKAGGLPSYIERIAKHLHFDRGMTISHAIAAAINRVKKWAAGTGNVSAATRAKAAKALAQWEKMKARSKAKSAEAWVAPWTKAVEDLTDTDIAELWDLIGEWQSKRDYSTDKRQEMAERGAAMPGGRYPIRDKADLRNAIQAYGRGNPSDKDKIKAHIKKRARALGLESMLPDSWKSMNPHGGDPENESGEMDEGLTAPGPGGSDFDDDPGTDTTQGEWDSDDPDAPEQTESGESKAGRMLSTSNATAIRSALTQLVQVLNRAGIAWGEDSGEGAPATKARLRGRSGYPWGEDSTTRLRRGPGQLDDDEDDDEAGAAGRASGAAMADSGVTDDDEDLEDVDVDAADAADAADEDLEALGADEEDEEDEDEEEGRKVYLDLSDLMEAAELRLMADL